MMCVSACLCACLLNLKLPSQADVDDEHIPDKESDIRPRFHKAKTHLAADGGEEHLAGGGGDTDDESDDDDDDLKKEAPPRVVIQTLQINFAYYRDIPRSIVH